MKNNVRNIIKDARGLVALEMALILPILIILFFGMLEYNRAYFHHQKTNKIAGTVADMVSMFQPIPDQTIAEIENTCDASPFMITESRLNAILEDTVVEALALPLEPHKVVIHVAAVTGVPNAIGPATPRISWKQSYTRDPDLALGYTFVSQTGSPGNPGDVVDFNALTGTPHTMFDNEVMIIVEVGIAYTSITGGLLDAFIKPLSDGWIRSNTLYASRSYILDPAGRPTRGINHVWPDNDSLEAIFGAGARSANPKGC